MTGLVVSPVPASHAVGSSASIAGISSDNQAVVLSATTNHTYPGTHAARTGTKDSDVQQSGVRIPVSVSLPI